MARYTQLQRGVFDNEKGVVVLPSMYVAWREYHAWLAQGNVPDNPPPIPTEEPK